MTLFFFDSNETLICTRSDMFQCVVQEGEYALTASLPIDQQQPAIKTGMLVGLRDVDGLFVLYEIKKTTLFETTCEIELYAEHAAMCELLDEVVTELYITDQTAGEVTAQVLAGTRYSLDLDQSEHVASTTLYYKSAWECLMQIKEKWACCFDFRWSVSGTAITGRYVSIPKRLGQARGKRFEAWKDIENAAITYDDSDVVTRVYGRGMGEEVGVDDSGEATYGRRITISDVYWSTLSGDPVDKPIGQEYMEDTAATALYGRCGRPRSRVVVFESETDQWALAQKTWNYLQANKVPKFSANLTVIDLERIYGFAHEAIRVGDTVEVILDHGSLSAEIIDIARDYIDPDKTRVTMGNYRSSAVYLQAKLMADATRTKEQATIGTDMVVRTSEELGDVAVDVYTIAMEIDQMDKRVTDMSTQMQTEKLTVKQLLTLNETPVTWGRQDIVTSQGALTLEYADVAYTDHDGAAQTIRVLTNAALAAPVSVELDYLTIKTTDESDSTDVNQGKNKGDEVN